jgi:hypothetical protein
MGIRASTGHCGGDSIVDHSLGEAYETVKEVADNLELLEQINADLAGIDAAVATAQAAAAAAASSATDAETAEANAEAAGTAAGTIAGNTAGTAAGTAAGTTAGTAAAEAALATKADLDHDHAIADVTGLQEALDGKQPSGAYAAAGHNHDGTYAPAAHNHDGAYAPLDHDHAAELAALELELTAAIIARDQWAPNWTADGSFKLPIFEAMTVSQGNAAVGAGTITFEKSTAAAPNVFVATALPVALEAGAWLKVTAVDVIDHLATHLKRTA